MKYLYRVYQLCVALPLIAVLTVLTAVTVIIGCHVGNGHFWGYYPGKYGHNDLCFPADSCKGAWPGENT